MGIGQAHQVHHALHRAILARHAMERVEDDIGRSFGKTLRDLPVHVDARDPMAARFQRLGHALAAHQRYRPLAGPAAHQDGYVQL